MQIPAAIDAALANVSSLGDTDIFPLPFENHLFRDCRQQCRDFLFEEFHKKFNSWLPAYPPQTITCLTQVGYTGFRWATLIDPFWNAYYLALVISIASQIEDCRVSESDETVFSYRYDSAASDDKLFKDSSWGNFRKKCLELSNTYPVVVQADISDFYPRIYHHRIENALHRLPNAGDIPKRIMDLLGSFSKNVSYGLPVGGPASRILSELALDGVDKLLNRSKIKYCRYADDYALFCNDKAEAYRILVFLSEKLANEGLVLQKKKTRILESSEFRGTALILDPMDSTNKLATEEQKLLNISIHFDPYSPTATEDYEQIRDAVNQIDIVGILGREIAKTTIDPSVSRQAIQAITALNLDQQKEATRILLDSDNLMTLAPVFVSVMRVIRDLYETFEPEFQNEIDNILCDLYSSHAPLLSVEVNLAYFVQSLAGNQTQRKEEILVDLYNKTSNVLIRRLIVLAMAKWRCSYWLSDVKNKYATMSIFERRGFILASYFLGDEGSHWRDDTKPGWQGPEVLTRDWYAARFQKNSSVPI